MSKNRPVAIEKSVVYPTNSSGGIYSFKNGRPLVTFTISGTQKNKVMDLHSLRLNCNFRIYQGGSTTDRPNNQDANGAGAYNSTIDSRIGCNSFIDTLRLRVLASGETIEEVRNYGHKEACILPALTSFDSYKTWMSNRCNAFARDDSEELRMNMDNTVSMPLHSGLLSSQRILDVSSLGGLVIDLSLCPDVQVLFGTDADNGSYYQLSDVTLTFDWIVMANATSPQKNLMEYPAYQSYYQVVMSGDDQQSLLLNLSSVRSVFATTISSSWLNNYEQNGFATPRLQKTTGTYGVVVNAKVKEYTHLRNGIKFNKQYSVDERQAIVDGCYLAHKNREYLSAFAPFRSIKSSLQTIQTQAVSSYDTTDKDVPEEYYVGGIAVNYDTLYNGSGVPFKNAMYSLRITSELDANPNSVFSFALSNQAMAVRKGQVQPVF